MPDKLSIVRDTLAYVPVKIIPAIAGLISIIVLTRNLSPDEYGQYSIVIAVSILMTQLFGTWLSNAILYLASELNDPEKELKFRNEAIAFQLILSIPAVIMTYITVRLLTNSHKFAIISSILVFFQLINSLLLTFYQAIRKINIQAIAVSTQSIFQLGVLSILFFLDNDGGFSALIALSAGYLTSLIALIFISCQSLFINMQLKINSLVFTRLWKYGAPMCIWFFSTQFYIISDRIFLKVFGYNEQLGEYASLRDLATGCIGLVVMPLLIASHPIIMRMWKNEFKQDVENIISNNIYILTLFFCPLIVGADVFGADLILEIFGNSYAVEKSLIILVIISIYISSINMHIQRGFELTGNTVLMAKLAFITGIFSSAGSLVFVYPFGAIGGASVVVASCALYFVLVMMRIRTVLNVQLLSFDLLRLIIWFTLIDIILHLVIYSCEFMQRESVVLISIILLIILTLIFYIKDSRLKNILKEMSI